MQTFLPYADYEASARVLDNRRLGKQRVENLQIMIALVEGRGWINHPAVRMWKGYEGSLWDYQFDICYEWSEVRGYQDTCLDKTKELVQKVISLDALNEFNSPKPWWFGAMDFHESHKSSLIRKDPGWYGELFPGVPDDLPYVWPV